MNHLEVEPPGCDNDDSSMPSEFKPGDPPHCNAKGSGGQGKSQLLHDHFDPGWQLSLSKWCALLFSQVIRTKSRFSRFIVDTLQIRRTESSPSPTLFPIPVDCYDVLGRMPPNLNAKKRFRFHLRRALHVIVMALNFWHFGGSGFDFTLLGRRLSSAQKSVYRKVGCLLKSEDQFLSVPVAKAGRKFPELCARLGELAEVVTANGLSGPPYGRSFQGASITVDNSKMPELEPYRSLNAERLLLTGKGHWDPTDMLEDSLIMPFREPNSLLCGYLPTPGEFPRCLDPIDEVVRLAHKWDEHSLLYVHSFDVPVHERVRVFNCWKNAVCDRQIGDRRGRNATEAVLDGPSRRLPTGPDFCCLVCNPSSSRLSISVSDRKDYYHQLKVTRSRALSNTVGCGIPASMLSNTKAYATFCLTDSARKKDRLDIGDAFSSCRGLPSLPPDTVAVSFASVFQGDHGGVEYATSGHEGLLQAWGCLDSSHRMTSDRPMPSDIRCDGLVIDDYYAVSVESRDAHSGTWSSERLAAASRAYGSVSLLGSPEKDLDGVNAGKVIGASLNSSDRAISCNVVTVASPLPKRLALSWISLQLAQLRASTDGLHVCLVGGLVSAMLYRRPFMGLLNRSFNLVDATSLDASHPRVIRLPAAVCEELILAAVLMPICMTNIGAEFHEHVFATDASQDKGAIVSAPLDANLQSILFRCCLSKGSYTRLTNAQERLVGLSLDGLGQPFPSHSHVERPLAQYYDFVEIYAGSAKVSKCMARLGWIIAPPVELSISEEYDLRLVHVMLWLSWLISARRVRAFMVEPVCTTFSIMRRPALRSKYVPFGFNVWNLQTLTGNQLALRALQCMALGHRFSVPGLLENPYSSLIRHLPSWIAVSRLPGASVCRTDSCRFGSIHLKPFRFLGVHCDLSGLSLKCRCSGKHVRIEGTYTKKSAIYTDQLAEAIAAMFTKAILAISHRQNRDDVLSVDGHENLLVNDVAKSCRWEEVSSWTFKKLTHINLQELSSVLRNLYRLARDERSLRIINLVDSMVCRGALNKGRSPSRAISSLLRRVGATLVAADMYLSVPFVPTRLNGADDPTRDTPLRTPESSLLDHEWTLSDIHKLGSHKPLRRWISNWSRLVIFLLGPSSLDFADRSLFRVLQPRLNLALSDGFPGLDFDQTLGYPGEGPSSWIWFFLPQLLMSLLDAWTSAAFFAMAMPMFPRSSADTGRAALRSSQPLVAGRRVLPQTNQMRERLWSDFAGWASEEGIDLATMLEDSFRYIDDINTVLVAYGRALYSVGRPYNHFAETINALSARKPNLRRHLQVAWSLAFGWLQQEPSEHHVAMPPQVLLAFLSVALMWGWVRVAGCVSLAYGGLLRAGEVISACRGQLLLPKDVGFSVSYALLTILEPKTRFTAARHQCAKIDMPDLLSLISLCFSELQPHQRLWPYSGQTLRTRFRSILQALGLPIVRGGRTKPLDLGSLRAGGATWMLNTTENAELTRRRGRWINAKTMEIYIQEVSSAMFLTSLDAGTRNNLIYLASLFPSILEQCNSFVAAGLKPEVWYLLFTPCRMRRS